MGTLMTNKKDLTREIVYKLQSIAFANLERNPHIKINHQLAAIKMMINLLNLADVGKNPDDYKDSDELETAAEAQESPQDNPFPSEEGCRRSGGVVSEQAEKSPTQKLSKKQQRYQEIREKAAKLAAALENNC